VRLEAVAAELATLPKGRASRTDKRVAKMTKIKSEFQRGINAKRSALTTINDQIARRQDMVDDIHRLRAASDKVRKLRRRMAVLSDLTFAFGNKGMRLDRMREILEEIGKRVPTYTQTLIPRYTFRLGARGEQINFDMVDDGVEAPVSSLSEGEKKRLSLALLLAERDMRTVTTNLLFLDEFDGGIDESGRDTLLDILSDLTEVYPSLFAISHYSDVLGHSAFSNRYRIHRGKRFSKMEHMGR
jgi:DNA repair exonuclease SbcCD ATPase subunit